jgi:ABC-type multidrug transport system ATPase subunit
VSRAGPVLAARGAARRFGDRVVFAGLDLDVAAGRRLLLLGPNGSGKTTLLRCAAGTLGLSAGSLLVAGRPAGSARSRAAVGLCLHPERGLHTALSGRDNLLLAARLRLPWRQAATAVDEVALELGVHEFGRLPVRICSAGMRARVSIARALLGAPDLVLLDEPTRSLDEEARGLLWAALDRRPALACVVASHQAEDRAHCDHTLTLPVRG